MKWLFHKDVFIPAGDTGLQGELFIPDHAQAIVIFSHGSGSSRHSLRNLKVAEYLHERKMGTLLFDLLTEEEDRVYANRFDIELLTNRLIIATEWLCRQPAVKNLPVCYFGASTGAASALIAAARKPGIAAVVSRGGRPDLAAETLPEVKSPTLLIVGSLDYEVLKLNRQAYDAMVCRKRLAIVEGATHLFEETGTMDRVCQLAAGWLDEQVQPLAVSNKK